MYNPRETATMTMGQLRTRPSFRICLAVAALARRDPCSLCLAPSVSATPSNGNGSEGKSAAGVAGARLEPSLGPNPQEERQSPRSAATFLQIQPQLGPRLLGRALRNGGHGIRFLAWFADEPNAAFVQYQLA